MVALELLATGVWSGTGVLGPEAFDAVPFLELLNAYGSPLVLRDEAKVEPIREPVESREVLLSA